MNLALTTIPILAQTEEQVEDAAFIEFIVLLFIFFFFVSWLARNMSTKQDKSWLPRLIMWGFAAKVAGTLARFWMVTVLYGTGDSYRYHLYGAINANVWQSFGVPESTAGGQGTAFTEVVTSFIYAPYTPTFLGAFMIFGLLSFLGQLLFLAAFRRWFGPRKVKLYAYAILFFPSLVFWPSTVGKDALMVLSLGLATYGVSRLLSDYEIGTVLLIAPALWLAASIRPHVAGIFGIATVAAMLFGRAPKRMQGHPKRAMMLLTALAGVAVLLATFSAAFEVSVEGTGATQDPSEFLADVNERTATGGSQIEGGGLASPSQLPLALVTVLFRPLIHEGTNAQVIVSALEGTALLALVIWKFPTMWRNKRLIRDKALVMLCFFYTGGFVLAFSAILNLGILARQRVQVLPFFLALIVALAWDEPEIDGDSRRSRRKGQIPRQIGRAALVSRPSVESPAETPSGPRSRGARPKPQLAPEEPTPDPGTGRHRPR